MRRWMIVLSCLVISLVMGVETTEAQRGGGGIQQHVVHEYPVGERVLPRQERRPVRRANRHARHGIAHVEALRRQPVEGGGVGVGVAGKAKGLRPPLIYEHVHDVGLFISFPGAFRGTIFCRNQAAGDQNEKSGFE